MKNLYEILGIKKSASENDVKKAYRRKANQHHPDKGGDSEKFKELVVAYNILRDPSKKKRYDDGEEADNIHQEAASEEQQILSTVMTLFVSCVGLNDPDRTDIIEQVKINLQKNIGAIQKVINLNEGHIRKFESAKKRLKCKGTHNIFIDGANAQIANYHWEITQIKAQKKIGEGALKFLKDFSYHIDEEVLRVMSEPKSFFSFGQKYIDPNPFGSKDGNGVPDYEK